MKKQTIGNYVRTEVLSSLEELKYNQTITIADLSEKLIGEVSSPYLLLDSFTDVEQFTRILDDADLSFCDFCDEGEIGGSMITAFEKIVKNHISDKLGYDEDDEVEINKDFISKLKEIFSKRISY